MSTQLNAIVEEGLGLLRDAKGYIKDTLIPKLADKDIPLNERWAAYCRLAGQNALPQKPFGDGYVEEFFDALPYDDFYIERYETVQYSDILHRARRHPPEDAVIRWKEKVLSEGYGAFKYDW